ncbi:MAG TPA: LLM class flavin-dependent oxidoreductase, partial [bacterium]|nr:LLM class flavin-dependent oxidoreductase [bacterium]
KFGIFYEHQLPRPWNAGDELRLYHEALDQVELADRLGIDYAWEVEHHFLEEYSHSSAPEVFLGACSQRTSRIRLGHGIMLMAPPYNHPARAAERIATLDLVSKGRVEWGTGESSSILELGGYGIPVPDKRPMWQEAVEQAANMMVLDPYPGWQGKYFSMPCRNLVPKPVQKPHPPLWVACSNRDTILLAARLGIGALTFAFVDPEDAKKWVDDYYTTLQRECVPIGHAINANIAMVMGFSCHADAEEARRRGLDGFKFFGYGLAHHYIFGVHQPGRTNIWANYEAARDALPTRNTGGIGTPEQLRRHLRGFADAGVDQVVFVQQGGRNRHEHICDSLTLFAREVMPEFHAEEPARLQAKAARLAPALEQAMGRKRWMQPLPEAQIPTFEALGRHITEPERLARLRQSISGVNDSLAIPERDPRESR